MQNTPPLVTICIPHWQVQRLATLCLRSIRKYTSQIPYEVLVVDNHSEDASLDYLRSLSWIRLVERKEETPSNPTMAHASALDLGIQYAQGKYFLSFHVDVVVKKEGWLEKLIHAIESKPIYASSGTGKLENPPSWYVKIRTWTDTKKWRIRLLKLLGRPISLPPRAECPRDFCALYKMDLLRNHHLSFIPTHPITPGETMYFHLQDLGYEGAMIPVEEMMGYLDHIAHGTAGIQPEKRGLPKKKSQRKVETRLEKFFAQPYIQELLEDASLDK